MSEPIHPLATRARVDAVARRLVKKSGTFVWEAEGPETEELRNVYRTEARELLEVAQEAGVRETSATTARGATSLEWLEENGPRGDLEADLVTHELIRSREARESFDALVELDDVARELADLCTRAAERRVFAKVEAIVGPTAATIDAAAFREALRGRVRLEVELEPRPDFQRQPPGRVPPGADPFRFATPEVLAAGNLVAAARRRAMGGVA